jgi:hypothetical protein
MVWHCLALKQFYIKNVGPAKIQRDLPDLKHNFFNFYWDYNNNILKVIRLSQSPVCPAELCRNASGTTTFLWSTHCHVAGTVSGILNRNGFGEGNDTNQGRHVFLLAGFRGVD